MSGSHIVYPFHLIKITTSMCIKFKENSLSFGEISMVQDMGETTSDNPLKLRSLSDALSHSMQPHDAIALESLSHTIG